MSLNIASRRPGDRAILGVVANANSSPDVSLNAIQTLHDRISTKEKACSRLAGPIWLALLNDYWLADAATWQQALNSLALAHRFERLFLFSWQGDVTELK